MAKPEVYFHVGLGKVASTYLQYRFFPKLRGIQYIQRTRYKKSPQLMAQGGAEKYLISREFDQQFEEEIKWFSSYYPDSKVIILLRRHDGWIASQYRRYVKNGGHLSFAEFFDVEGDTGLWKRHHVYFYPLLQLIEQYFTQKPLVLFYDDFKADPWAFFDQMATFMGATYDKSAISLDAVHPSYSEKQLKVMRRVAARIFGKEQPQFSTHPIRHWFQRRGRLLACYMILYPAKLWPAAWTRQEELTPEVDKQKIRAYFSADWDQCRAYARALELERRLA